MTAPRHVDEAGQEWVEWWDATRERRLLVQRCTECGKYQFYPRSLCTHCGSDRLEWAEASGAATVYSHTTVYRPPPVAPEPPYVVALVRLAEGPLMETNVVGCKPADVRCDMPVAVDWEPLDDGRNLPVFRPS